MATLLQITQRNLAWKLRMVTGARSNLYPREQLPESIRNSLVDLYNQLAVTEQLIKCHLKQNKDKRNETLTTNSK